MAITFNQPRKQIYLFAKEKNGVAYVTYIYGFQKSFLSTQIIAIFFINNGIGMHTTNALYLLTIEWVKDTKINENRGKNQELFVMRPKKVSHTQHHLDISNVTGT